MKIRLISLLSVLACLAAPQWANAAENDPVAFDCADGTALSVAFDGDTAHVTLASGAVADLKIQTVASGFHYISAKFSMRGKGNEIAWSVGKKAPVSCTVRDDAADAFDDPVDFVDVPLPADPANPDVERKINCYRYPDFAVKEVDYGELGAQKLAIIAKDAKCEETDAKERIVPDLEGYFLGAKGNFVFFTGADGFNGGMPFYVYRVKDLSKVFEDSFQGDTLDSIEIDGDRMVIDFTRSTTLSCSMFKDDGSCAKTLAGEVKGLGSVVPLPDCMPAYLAEQKRTPEYAKEIEDIPPVMTHRARLTVDSGKVSVEALPGETTCHMAD